MPGTFDYECSTCGNGTFELFVDFSEKDEQLCPGCDGPLKRLLSPPRSFTIWANSYDPSGGTCGGPREFERKMARKECNVIAMGNETEDSVHKWGARLRREAKEREDKERRGAIDKMFTDLGDDLYTKT